MNANKLIKNFIGKGKWAVFFIGSDKNTPAFAYTAGLSHYGLNELLITGNLSPQNACGILNMMGDMLLTRKEKDPQVSGFSHGEQVSLGGAYPLTVFNANRVARETLMLNTHGYYHGSFRAQQIVFPDKQGRLPTDPTSEFATGEARLVGQPLYI